MLAGDPQQRTAGRKHFQPWGSRQQLGGLSTIVILIMSAVGGSMFPRFLMSETV